MKRSFILKLTFLLSFFVALVTSCSLDNNDEDYVQYWYSYGTYQVDNPDYIFTVLLDNGDVLLPLNAADFEVVLDHNTRVLLTYSIDSEDESTVHANIVDLSSILTGDITQLTEENKDSIGDDGIVMNDEGVWLSKYHLNITFGYFGGGADHYIHLVRPIGEQKDSLGNQILEFRHNANDDKYTETLYGIMAFDMDGLYEEGLDSLPFVLRAYDYDSALTEFKGTHYFNGTNLMNKEASNNRIEFSALIN